MPFPYAREHLLIYCRHRLFIYCRHRSKLLSFALPCHFLLSKASPLGTCDALVRKEVPSALQGFHFNSPHPFDFYQANRTKWDIFQKKLRKHFVSSRKSYTFALAFPENTRTSTLRKEFFDKIYINRK